MARRRTTRAHGRPSDGIVGPQTFAAQIVTQNRRPKDYDPVGSEPILRDYLYDQMLKVCGRLSLCGAPADIVQGVRQDMENLFDLTVATLQAAYRDLWDGCLPIPNENGLKTRTPASGDEEATAESSRQRSALAVAIPPSAG